MQRSRRSNWFLVLGLVAVLSLSACSSGGDDPSSGGTAGGTSEKEYCAAVQSLYDLTQANSGSVVPADQQGQVVDELALAAAAAPAAVKDDYLKSLGGDSYARDNVDVYNKAKCGIDTALLRTSP